MVVGIYRRIPHRLPGLREKYAEPHITPQKHTGLSYESSFAYFPLSWMYNGSQKVSDPLAP